MDNLENVNFKIQEIKTERSLDGNSIIKAKVLDGFNDIILTVKLKNRDVNKLDHIRRLLLDEFRKHLTVNKPILKVGDVI